jgi:hypothetical protein
MKASPAKTPALLGFMIDRIGIIGAQRDRLFHEHMLAGADRLDRPFGMAGVGCGDVDGVDLADPSASAS